MSISYHQWRDTCSLCCVTYIGAMTYIFCLLCRKSRSWLASAGWTQAAAPPATAAAKALRLLRSAGAAQQWIGGAMLGLRCLLQHVACGSCAIQQGCDPLRTLDILALSALCIVYEYSWY